MASKWHLLPSKHGWLAILLAQVITPFLFILNGCSKVPATLADEAAIYQTLIESGDLPKGTKILTDEKQPCEELTAEQRERWRHTTKWRSPEKRIEIQIDEQALEDWFAKFGQESELWTELLKLDSWRYVPRAELDDSLKSGGWEAFYRKFPNSAGIFFSGRVGFNRRKTKALVWITHRSNYLGGNGSWYYLEYKKGRWHLVTTIMVWAV